MMMSDPIQDYLLKSERNLRLGAAVGEAWPAARDMLVDRFCDQLGSRLLKVLRGWTYAKDGRFFADPYSSCYITKPAWKQDFFIELSCAEYGDRLNYGVSRDANRPEIKKRPLRPEILDAVRQVHPGAKTGVWWEAKLTMRSPAADWRKPDVLWRMHKDKEFLDEVAEQILAVAKAAEPAIDRLVRKKAGR